MKKINRCPVCGRFFRTSLGYQLEITEEKNLWFIKWKTKSKKIVCPICNKKVGYIGSKKKISKLTKIRNEISGFTNK